VRAPDIHKLLLKLLYFVHGTSVLLFSLLNLFLFDLLLLLLFPFHGDLVLMALDALLKTGDLTRLELRYLTQLNEILLQLQALLLALINVD
jgi:hypothetical protein